MVSEIRDAGWSLTPVSLSVAGGEISVSSSLDTKELLLHGRFSARHWSRGLTVLVSMMGLCSTSADAGEERGGGGGGCVCV